MGSRQDARREHPAKRDVGRCNDRSTDAYRKRSAAQPWNSREDPCREIFLSVELTAFKPAILESEPGLSLTFGGMRPDKFLPALKGCAAATSNHF